MNQIKFNTKSFIMSIISIFLRDLKIQFRNISYIMSILTFFVIVTLIFIFAIGPEKDQLRINAIPIMWTILILSSCITVNKLLKEDFDDGNFNIYQFTGLSFEIIAISKIITSWILFQLPIIILIPLISILLNLDFEKIIPLITTIAIGSPILTTLTLISSSMLLTNNKNLTLGSLIIVPMSIPVIIFSVGAINSDSDLFVPQLQILLSLFFASIATAPWIIAACIKIALRS